MLASWAELLLESTPLEPSPELERARGEVVRRASVHADGPTLRFALTAGSRVRDLAAPIATGGGSLFAGVALSGTPLELGVVVGGEWGRAERRRGWIDLGVLSAGLAGRAHLALHPAVALVPALRASYAYVFLGAGVTSPDARAGSLGASALELAAELALAFRVRPLEVSLLVELGVTAWAPEGTVTAEANVAPGGLFLGLAARLALPDLEHR